MKMTSSEIRQQFLDFFKRKGHEIVPSSPVVPFDDPTLLFTNAGMNQFKDVFLATGSRPYKRAANTQKCIRAGGKHNDLDDVGKDTYHHTFFEMLGNWSFGDYFKKEAICWAWELLTEVWGIEKDRLHATYFEGNQSRDREGAGEESLEPDLESRDLWLSVTDIDPSHVHPGGKKDNFWEMGDTGPCGPCSEIHVDLTPDKIGSKLVNAGDPRVIELWNLVFIQYNRDAAGKLTPLPQKHVDTGMGLERLVAVLTGKKSNYDTDVFTPIFDAIQKRTEAAPYTGTLPGKGVRDQGPGARGQMPDPQPQLMIDVSYRVIADHLRALTFALTDGAVPSNEGRGYVLRRILRRAARYGRQYMNMHEPFLYDLVQPLANHLADAFPELCTAHANQNVKHVAELIREEEVSFGKTLDRGIRLFDEAARFALTHNQGRITGQDAFKLHDTYGFPIDLTEQMAEEQGLTIDIGEYEQLMEQARERARTGTLVTTDELLDSISFDHLDERTRLQLVDIDDSPKYVTPPQCDAKILYTASSDPDILVVTDRTCFYVEQGGQVADTGTIRTETGEVDVQFVQRKERGIIVHKGRIVSGEINPPQTCRMNVKWVRRQPIMQNHTATHLLNCALREVLGEHVDQKGSLVDPEKTRFDFSHNKPLRDDEIERIEALVEKQIHAGYRVYTKEVNQADARRINTLRAVFGEKYPDVVRVVSVGVDIDEMLADPNNEKWMQYSVEFCGGTHVDNSADVERFVLVAEEGVSKGVRRVVGVTGESARQAIDRGKEFVEEAKTLADEPPVAPGEPPVAPGDPRRDDPRRDRKGACLFSARITAFQKKVNDCVIPIGVRHELKERLAQLQKRAKQLEKQQAAASSDAVLASVAKLLDGAEMVSDVTVVVGEVPPATADALRSAIDWVRHKTKASAVLLACASDKKVTLVAGMSKTVVAQGLKAGELIREVAPLVGGKGGGRPDMAQGGGSNPAAINTAIEHAKNWIADKL